MEESITKELLLSAKYVPEITSFIEVTAFSSSSDPDALIEGRLDTAEIRSWIRYEPPFEQQIISDKVKKGSLRLLTQETVHPHSFDKGIITFPEETWPDALRMSIFSSKAIEIATCPGLILWTDMSTHETRGKLDLVMQCNSTHHSNSKWMLSLSHDMKSRETVGFYKATKKGGVSHLILQRLKTCGSQASNPFLLPMLILQDTLNSIGDRQRAIRGEVRRIEDALGLRNGLQASHHLFTFLHGNVDFDFINREIVEASAQLLKQRPSIYLAILNDLQTAMEGYRTAISKFGGDSDQVHAALMSRLKFQQKTVQVMERYHQFTSSRLNAQANALYNLIVQKDNKLNFLVATESRRIAAASKYENIAMRTISILGVVFLPGTFIASILSTSFFNFQEAAVSPLFWIYWALTIPLTLIVLVAWGLWYRTNKRNQEEVDRKLEQSMLILAERKTGLTAKGFV